MKVWLLKFFFKLKKYYTYLMRNFSLFYFACFHAARRVNNLISTSAESYNFEVLNNMKRNEHYF